MTCLVPWQLMVQPPILIVNPICSSHQLTSFLFVCVLHFQDDFGPAKSLTVLVVVRADIAAVPCVSLLAITDGLVAEGIEETGVCK